MKFVVIGIGNLATRIAAYLRECEQDVDIYRQKSGLDLDGYATVTKEGKEFFWNNKEVKDHLLWELEKREIFVVNAIGFYIFPTEIVNHKNFKGINYHNAILPNHRGMNAEAWQIYGMDKYAGVTWHFLSDKLDDGDIICQEKIFLDERITSRKLLQIQSNIAYELFLTFARQIVNRELLKGKKQIKENDKVYHKIKDIPNEGMLDLKWEIKKMSAFLRAMDYGIINTLGAPKVIIQGKTYEIKKYQIKENEQICDIDSCQWEGDSFVIRSKECDTIIILKNLVDIGE